MRPAWTAASSLAIALLLALVTSVAACGGSNAASDTAAPEAEAAEEEEDDATAGVGGSSSSDKEWRGWRWKGKRSACFFRHRNSCYDKLEAACRAAKCDEARCRHSDGVPAVVSCSK